MRVQSSCWWSLSMMALVLVTAAAHGAEPKVLLDVSAPGAEKRLVPSWGSDKQVSATRSQDPAAQGVILNVQPGEAGYPGMALQPDGAASWDLSGYGHVEAKVVNVGPKAASFALRVDNAPDGQGETWNTESAYLKPGEAQTVSVIFGHQYGQKPGYALKPNAVVNILMFTSKADGPQAFRVEKLVADGPAGEKPPVDPNSIRILPKAGVLLAEGSGTRVVLAAGSDQAGVIKPSIGRWDLREATEIRIVLKNEGTTTVTPRVQAVSDGNGATDTITAGRPLAPGQEREIVVPFAAATTWKGIPNSGDRTSWEGQAGTGTKFCSDAVSGIRIMAENAGTATLLVKSVTVAAPPAALPEWLGKRPPVDGDWAKTFDEEFDGSTVDSTKWRVDGPNYYDKTSHWSKDNVIVAGGVAKLRYEKKTGYHNDDPKGTQSAYASGYMDTYGKWVQRYGYFEARMKLPGSPGLWPAFWMMPDRGAALGEQWKRQDTLNGGMEMDIMEHVTRWGPHRYNIAMHWDGYNDKHKQTGTGNLYVRADKDGFITAGLLWTPGLIVYYCNGKEVARWEDPRISSVQSDLMFTLPMGGWDNNGLDDAQLPAEFEIDYVRCWQRKDLASPADTQPLNK